MSWAKDVRLSAKLGLSFSLMFIILVAVSLTGLVNISKIGTVMSHMYEENIDPLERLKKLNQSIYKYRIVQLRLLHEDDLEDRRISKNELVEYENTIHQILSDEKIIFNTEKDFEIEKFRLNWAVIVEQTTKILMFIQTSDSTKAMELTTNLAKDFLIVEQHLAIWDKTLLHHIELHLKKSVEIKNESFNIVLFLFICGALISLLSAFGITRIISKPLNLLVKTVEKIERTGDFSIRAAAENKDEVGRTARAVNSLMASTQSSIFVISQFMQAVAKGDFTYSVSHKQNGDLGKLTLSIEESIELLSQMIDEITTISHQVSLSSGELSRAATSLARGSSTQAANLEEISSSMEEVRKRTNVNNENASKAQSFYNKVLENINEGSAQMQNMLDSMKQINDTSINVSKVIQVIDEIAFQTNLLALNAAVEAARAGKFGKGFGVVAEEVRNLAGRSTKAAKSTNELIEISKNEVENGVTNTDKTAGILHKIDESMSKVNDLMDEIFDSSTKQRHSVDEINKGLAQVNEVVHNNSSISEETASASEELSSQAAHLLKIMQQFKLKQDAGDVAVLPKQLS